MKKSNLIIGWLHRDSVHPLFMNSVQAIRDQEEGRVETIDIHSSPKVDMGRNELFRIWLTETSATRLLMVDDDMVYPPDTAKRLRTHNKDIVGGLYFQASWKSYVKPAITQTYTTENGEPYLEPYWDYPLNQLVKVTGLGGGFMMISRKAAESIWDARGRHHLMPWFAHSMHLGVPIGEDVAFCLTAAKCHFSVWCDTSLEAWHMKSMPITSDSYLSSLLSPYHPRYTQRDGIPLVQEWMDGYSDDSNQPGSEGVPQGIGPRLVNLSPNQ